jgi:iron complex outermembrane receptor protein
VNKLLLATTISSLLAGNALAQDTNQSANEENTQSKNVDYEQIVVTGTSRARLIAETPQSTTSLGEAEVAKLAMSSQADVLRYVPGVKVEGGGGEVATNLQVRGLPSSGQFQFTPLLYDGSPTLSAFGLNSSAYDVYYRNDLGIERVEFVRGGVSNLFGQGSVAGVINYLSKKGTEEAESTVQLELSDNNRKRIDFATSGPLNENGMFYALSGFYRYDEGPIDTGLPTEGYQLRGNLHKELDDGSGYFTIYGQAIDDEVQFFLPIPLDSQSRDRVAGNDGREVESTQTFYASGLSYDTANGRYTTPIEEGVATRGGSISMEFQKELGNDFSVLARAKYASYDHQFNLFLDGDGIINVPETQSEYLANRGLGDVQDTQFTYAGTDIALPEGDLLFANRILDRDRPVDDFSSELNIVKYLDIGDFSHSITVGTFFSSAEAEDNNVITRYLGEFNNQARLVDLTITDSDNNEIIVSQNGVTGPGISYSDATISARRTAFYLADQMQSDDWIIDVGLRWEEIDGTITREGSQTVIVNDDPSLYTDLQQNVTGNGALTHGNVTNSEVAYSIAALYKLADNFNVYANYSRGFFFPELRGVAFDPNGQPGTYESEIVKQAELGAKFFFDDFVGTVALFKTDLEDRRSVDFVNDENGVAVEVPIFQSTEAQGIEVVGSYNITDDLIFDANFTYTDHEFTEYESDPSVVGNELRRKPKVMFNSSLRYTLDDWDISFYHNYHGKNYTNDANTVELDDFHVFRLDTGYTWELGQGERIRTSIAVWNLFDSDGITEGSPRLGNSQTAGESYFVGRPILPRRVTLRIRYDF